MKVKTTLWKTLFGKEADKLEHANDDERTYYIIEKEPIVNTFISVPKVLFLSKLPIIGSKIKVLNLLCDLSKPTNLPEEKYKLNGKISLI